MLNFALDTQVQPQWESNPYVKNAYFAHTVVLLAPQPSPTVVVLYSVVCRIYRVGLFTIAYRLQTSSGIPMLPTGGIEPPRTTCYERHLLDTLMIETKPHYLRLATNHITYYFMCTAPPPSVTTHGLYHHVCDTWYDEVNGVATATCSSHSVL